MALFAPPTTTCCRGEGSSRKRAAAPARFEDDGWAPGAPGRWRPSGRAGHLGSGYGEDLRRLAVELCARNERPETALHDRVDRDDTAARDDCHRAAVCAPAYLDDRAREGDRVKPADAPASLERVAEQCTVRADREQGRARPAGAEQPQLPSQRLLAQP